MEADATLSVDYAARSFSQTGGAEPVMWSHGTLPPGMSLSTDGVLAGTPTTFGVFNITVTATDGCGNTTNRLQTITLRDTTKPALTLPPNPLAAPTVPKPTPKGATDS